MVAVFLAFVLGDDPATKMFGLGLATAIFVDATVVRMVLVPATMTLLGDANWWLPTGGRTDTDRGRYRPDRRARLDSRTYVATVPALALTLVLAGLVAATPGQAFNYVSDSNGTWWGIQDFAPPRVDTGRIRATQVGAGQNPAYSTTINGFGGIKVRSPARRASTAS